MHGEVRVKAYHGTTRSAAVAILRGGFVVSRNSWDWLGDGVYFFQDAPLRAWDWAVEHHGDQAAVVGVAVQLEDCMDLLDIEWSRVLTDSYNSFLRLMKDANIPLPVQTAGAHRLDRAVINYMVGVLQDQGTRIRAVRGAFLEGSPVYPNSALYDRSHIQIAVRDLSLIKEVWIEQERTVP